MAPGGFSSFCDDCGYQACLAQGDCLQTRGDAIGVLLTGMGRDGGDGLLAMRRAGKTTIAQDQASSAVYGMPRAAAELDAAQQILPLDRIGASLRSRLGAKLNNGWEPSPNI